jgi:choline transport protein
MLKRVRKEPLLASRWSLGKFSSVANVVALAYIAIAYVFAFFPVGIPVDAQTMNWATMVYGGVVIVAAGYYMLYARHRHMPPVAMVLEDL